MGIATIPEDSLAPLLMSLALFFFFVDLRVPDGVDCARLLILTFLIGCFWMWPRTEKEVV